MVALSAYSHGLGGFVYFRKQPKSFCNMSNRNYNVFFNTHTVSGIVISVALYVIFFAGAFALFKQEIAVWEAGKPLSHTQRENIDYDGVFQKLDAKYELLGRDLQINFGQHTDKITVYMFPSQDSLANAIGKQSQYTIVDINTKEEQSYSEDYSLGEFLYRLHFFAQLPTIGMYLAGFVSLFFLFAIVTGVIVHWRKMVSNFFAFNPKGALKRLWTEAHTALGVIGLPFQFVFAVTGAYFGLSILVLLPANFLYNGNQQKLLEDLRPERATFQWIAPSADAIPSFNAVVKQTTIHWNNFSPTRAFIRNYGGENMKYVIQGEIDGKREFISNSWLIYDAHTGKIEASKSPFDSVYSDDIQYLMTKLHFANFGGIPIKLLYFILAFITCFVIMTGVLIWIEARNKKSMTLKQRLYTAKIGHIYLAICLSIMPVTALSFIFVKICHGTFTNKMNAIYLFYFTVWLLFIVFFRYKRDNYFTHKTSLLLTAILGFVIPIINGFVSGNWIWKMIAQNQFDIWFVDVLWLVLAATCLLFYSKTKKSVREKSAFYKNPINFKNVQEKLAEENRKNRPETTDEKNHNTIRMRTKIVFLWILSAIFWLVHHLYGLFNIYYQESLLMDGATGLAPMEHHLYRILFEGLCFLFALLTIEVSKPWFKTLSLVWAVVAGIYNIYHFIAAAIGETENISEIFILLLTVITSIYLIKNIRKWQKTID